MNTKTREIIEVYVRLDESGEARTLSFNRPADLDVSDSDLLYFGFAIDGDSLVLSASGGLDEDEKQYVPMAEALRGEQQRLVRWLESHGYGVTFK